MESLLRVPQVAQRLSCSAWRVYELIRRGALPAVYLGPRQMRIQSQALADFIAAGGAREKSDERPGATR